MRHPHDGSLRRLCDEPLSVPASERAHIDRCDRCQERLADIREAAREAAAILGSPQPRVDPNLALLATRSRLSAEKAVPAQRASALEALRMRLRSAGLAVGVGAAAVLVGALALTPAGSLAQSFLSDFQPTHVVAVQVDASDLQSLPLPRNYGTFHFPRNARPRTATSVAQAATEAGMTVLRPAYLPAKTPSTATYQVIPQETASYTLSAAKARAAAARTGKGIPAMPAGMDGSTLYVKTGPVVVALYGQSHDIPALVVGQMRAPEISSTGASVEAIEDYLLGLPGVSPNLAASIKALGDPAKSGALPIPIPVNMASAQSVQVNGVSGLVIGDSTGVGSVVVWEKDGIIYGVGGTITKDDALRVANSLK